MRTESESAVRHEAFDFVEGSAGVLHYVLKANGLNVLILPDDSTSVAAFMVTYHVGSRNEGLGTTGATHLLEHLMFKGSERFNRKLGTDVFEVLQQVGAQVNATTWLDRTNYYEVLPIEHLALAASIEADRMRNALIAEEDLASERIVVLNELDRGRNEPVRNLHDSVWASAFVAHPYRHPTIGWRSDVEGITAADLRAFYDTFYWPNNATVTLIGGVGVGDALELVDEHFGAIPASPHPIPEVRTREPEQTGPRRVVVRQAGEVGAVIRAYKTPSALEADSDALDVLSHVLTAGMSSRGYRMLTDVGLTTSVSSYAGRHRDPGLFQIYAMAGDSAGLEEIDEACERLIRSVVQEGVTNEELKRARSRIEAQEAYGRDGPFQIAAQLNEAIAAGDWKLYTTFRERIEQVTAEDVVRVASQYLKPESLTTGFYEPISSNGASD